MLLFFLIFLIFLELRVVVSSDSNSSAVEEDEWFTSFDRS